MFLPDALHGGGTDALGFRHGTDAPMGRVFRGTVQGRLHQGGFLCGRNFLWPARARPILQNAGQPVGLVASSPEQYRRQRGRQLARQHLVGDTFGRTQNDSDPERNRLRSASQLADLKQLLTFTLSQRQRGSGSTRHSL